MKAHRVQHRAESEETKRNRVQAEIKRENQKLRREVARLNKELEKAKAVEPTGPEFWQKWAKEELKKKEAGLSCPKCSSTLTVVQLPTGALKVCKFCGHREKTNGRERKTA